MSVLSILPWNTCNARCDHCGPESGPRDRTGLTDEEVFKLIDDAAERFRGPEEWCLSLSGGEVFLYYDRLLSYCVRTKQRGGYVTLITNGFWATSVSRAVELLRPLQENGLRLMGMSMSAFHQEYVSEERVLNALRAAGELRLRTHIRVAATRSHRMWKIMQELSAAGLWFTDFMEMPVTPAGRAGRTIAPSELLRTPEYPRGTCPAAGMTINPKGDAMVCCNGAGEVGLTVGNVRKANFNQLQDEFDRDEIVDYLKRFGPAAALELLGDAETSKSFEERGYVSVCHLCHDVFSNEELRERIRVAVRKKLWDYLMKRMPEVRLALEQETTHPPFDTLSEAAK